MAAAVRAVIVGFSRGVATSSRGPDLVLIVRDPTPLERPSSPQPTDPGDGSGRVVSCRCDDHPPLTTGARALRSRRVPRLSVPTRAVPASEPAGVSSDLPGDGVAKATCTRTGPVGLPRPRVLQAEDRALVAAGRRDTRAFARLYDRLAPAAVGVATVVTGDEERAHLAVSEAFIELWRTAATVDVQRTAARTRLLALVQQRAIVSNRPAEVQPDILRCGGRRPLLSGSAGARGRRPR